MEWNLFKFYVSGSVIFLLVLYYGEFLFSIYYKKRKNFGVRYIVTHIAVIFLSLLPTLLFFWVETVYDNIIATNVTVFGLYLLMFGLSVAAMKLCYEESFALCLISGVAAYATQHIYYSIYSIINEAAQLETKIYISVGETGGYFLCIAIQLAMAAAVLALIYFLFAKKASEYPPDVITRKNVIFVSGSTLVIVLFVNAICNICAADNLVAAIFCKSLLAVCCFFVLILHINMLESGKVKNDLDIVTNLNQQERQHFERLKENMNLISIKCHDIKHFIQVADKRNGIDTSELNDIVKIYDETIKTGNEIIDTILSERNLYCTAHGINMTVMADASSLDFINATDMCSLFGNMLENAIEAVSEIEDTSRRMINVNIRPVAGQIFFCIENSYSVEPVIRDGLPLTTKSDGKNHGFGMKSIKMIAEKYDGIFTCGAENNIFRVSILFPVK